jgi:aldehyde:ferredoxin oxidoreductase
MMENAMNGYTGTLLNVDLTTGAVQYEALDELIARQYLGGMGLGVRLAYDRLPPEIHPFDPQSLLIFTTGPLTATAFGTAGRYQVIFKSPLTGILCDSSSSGYWGATLKQSGYDGLIVSGKAEQPVYLYIDAQRASLHPAEHLWGRDPFQVEAMLKEEIGDPKASVITIGVGGERRVAYASILNDEGRTAGRGGGGAVMGAKNLKAVVVSGSKSFELADPEGYRLVARTLNRIAGSDPRFAGMRKYGTASGLDGFWPVSNVPTKNWQIGSYEEICTQLGGKHLNETILKKHPACYRCPITCARWMKIEDGPYKVNAPGPEYETLGALGSMTLVDDPKAVSYAGHLCNIYGIDTISTGSTIAFVMECLDRKLLSIQDLDGIQLTWGNAEALVAMVHKIGLAEGIGERLGRGVRSLAQEIGGGSEDFAVHVKGMEAPMHDPRARFAWATAFATGPRGACHLHGNTGIYEDRDDPIPEWGLVGRFPRHSDAGKAQIARLAQNWSAIISSLVICYFAAHTLNVTNLVELINHATSWDVNPNDLLLIGDRINNLFRAYNFRCGVRRADDTLPKRLLTPMAEGGAAGKVPDLEYQLDEFYRLRGWEADGKPSLETLQSLGLNFVVNDLYGGN